MHRLAQTGAALTGLSFLGYVVGVLTPYPGRAFSVTGLMVGISMWLIGNALKAGVEA